MPLESDKMRKMLQGKLQASISGSDHEVYKIHDDKGIFISKTALSRGSKETLTDRRVSEMSKQLRLDTPQQLVDLVSCSLDRSGALAIMQKNRNE